MEKYWKLHKLPILIVLISAICYNLLAFNFQRDEFIKLISIFLGLSILCYKLIEFEKLNFRFLLFSGIIFRIIFLLILPNLSQDYFRFIWDGELLSNGLNPYLKTPNQLIEESNLIIDNVIKLYNGMGSLSAKHYSNYPPLNQIIFAISVFIGGKSIAGSVVVMRLFIISADIGIVLIGRKLLKKINRAPHLIFWYFLNPLVIVELTGNLHFEGVMLFFFIWSLYLISKNNWKIGGVIYALSISVKLVPLVFLPLFLKHLGFKKSIFFYSIIGLTTLTLIAPFYSSEFIHNYSKTIGLWFSNFEFNSSIYNLVKEIAVSHFDAKPWELIKVYGKITPIIVITSVLLFTFFKVDRNITTLITAMLWVLSIYYFTSATVHPWYIIFLILLTVFTNYRYSIVWSLAVVLSYWAYSNSDYKEHLGILLFEYIAVYGFMFYEIFKLRNKKHVFCKKNTINDVKSN
ncbi:mannosyltransferase [Cellulophaga sp. HaHaR_3_176]|uniref:mannosyltransferase n=1 Tax=Cellulophaga sp. HaHaR_3_176 TaxID=1942464 RepID=UPI001C1FAC9C|nr:mannosyltransferase [Cellulophaga sp. HaHaR_3_176]QWX83179.1 mannosyltransferase [Cellulophaga sp. HaHaR_3_176]